MSKTTEHKEGKASVKAIYFTSKTLADGSHPFMIRITKDRKRKYIATGITLHPQFWNKDTQTFRRNVPLNQKKQIEATLRKWEERYSDAAEALAEIDQEHDVQTVATKISDARLNTRRFKLIAYFSELIKQFENTGHIGNRKVYKDVQNNLQKFIGSGKDISFDEITVTFCNEWENYMRESGLREITISLKFRTLRTVLNKAIANGFAKVSNYPFARNVSEKYKYQIGKLNTKTAKRALSKDLIKLIETYTPPIDTGKYASLRNNQNRLQLAKDLFLFSYYCGGINFVDMALLKWSNITKDLNNKYRLNYKRKKNKIDFSVPITLGSEKILDRYKKDRQEFIFPILNENLHKTEMQIHNRCNKILGQVNEDLKTIGISLGINTPLTTYVARHSFGSVLKQAGISESVISEIYKHSNEKVTKIYLSEFSSEETDIVFENL